MVWIKAVRNRLENTLQLGESKGAFPKSTDSSHEGWEHETSRKPKHKIEWFCPCRVRKLPNKSHHRAAGTRTIAVQQGLWQQSGALHPKLLSPCHSLWVKSLTRSSVFGWPSFQSRSLPKLVFLAEPNLHAEAWLQREWDMSLLPFQLSTVKRGVSRIVSG